MLPKNNSDYSDSIFWEQRYCQHDNRQQSNAAIREWLGDFNLFSNIFRQNVSKSSSILMLGCGNSLLSEQMFIDGYENIHNIDISSSVIKQMSKHCDKCSQMKWSVMDCQQMKDFPNEFFDVVIEKATLDVFLVAEKSPWTVSNESIVKLRRVAGEITRVLKKNHGQFFSITFSAPHFRQPLLENMFDVQMMKIKNVHILGSDFHFYLYHLVNDISINSIPYFKYQPPTIIQRPSNDQSNFNKEGNYDNFLCNIDL